MAYIGREPQIGNFQVCDAISTVNNQAAYTMQVGGVNVSPETANHMLVSLNGILQAPTTSFTVSGSTITFAANLVTGDVINFIHILGSVLDLGVPSDSTVSLAKLTATGTKNSTTFLRGDNTFGVPPNTGITMADQFRLTANKTSNGDIDANLERCNTGIQGTLGTGMSQSSGIFTFPSTGIYQVLITGSFTGASENAMQILIKGTADNSTYVTLALIFDGQRNTTNTSGGSSGSTIVDITNTSTHKIKFAAGSLSSGSSVNGSEDENHTTFSFIRLGDT